MTLIVAIPAQGGVIFGSDSQVTTGTVRSTGTKIYQLNNGALWAGAGELALIQRVAEGIEDLRQKDQSLTNLRDPLAQVVMQSMESLLKVDFRTQFVARSPEALLQLHSGDFLFVECREGHSRILHISVNGTPEWIEGRPAVTGSGHPFAYALMRKYDGVLLSIDCARLLAYKVIEEAIEVGAYGLGLPIDIWEVTANYVKRASTDEVDALEDTARLLRVREVEMLGSAIAPEHIAGQAEAACQAAEPAQEAKTADGLMTGAGDQQDAHPEPPDKATERPSRTAPGTRGDASTSTVTPEPVQPAQR